MPLTPCQTGHSSGPWPLAYELLGDPRQPVIVLIMGLGLQWVAWPDSLCQTLLDSGFCVLRFDNRDCGLSSRAPSHGRFTMAKVIAAALLKLPVPAPYTLHDMAQDTQALLDELGIKQAHIVGVSMGAMIGQIMAAMWPDRVLSLTSIMSSSGNPKLPRPSLKVRWVLLQGPKRRHDVEAIIDQQVRILRTIGSCDGFESEAELRQRVALGVRRSHDPAGLKRQVMAIIASGDRRALLQRITAPTLVIHGRCDPLISPAAGADTARHIKGARLLLIDDMGHDLAPHVLPQLAQAIVKHCQQANPGH